MWPLVFAVILIVICILFGLKLSRDSEKQFDSEEESVFQKKLGLCDEYDSKK